MAQTASSSNLNVLVVDDEQDIRDGSERILSRMGFGVFKATRGDEALEIFAAEEVAIVLVDLKMPGMDGMEVLARIREIDDTVLVIVITGYATVETAIEAMKQGAYDFIPKPFEPDQLRIVVNRGAEKIRLLQETTKLEEEKRRTLADLGAEKSRTHTILESLPDGVMVTNAQGNVVLMNPSCKRLLGLDAAIDYGEKVVAYIDDIQLCDLIMEISQGRHLDFDDIPTHEFSVTRDKYLLARAQPVISELKECLGAVVNFVDISSMKVVDRLKSEFVAKVSHELRSPLSTIHEQLAVVLKGAVDDAPEDDHHMLARAKEKTYSLIALIGDLLDLSRIEEGIICREPQPVKADELLASVVDFLCTQSEKKEQSLTLQLPEAPLPEIGADPIALESIFGNLITNAIKYTPEGGEIKVRAELSGLSIRITVADNGFGIEEKDLEKIFDRFYRIKDDNTRFINGTGLGLPIVKGLLDSLGGYIEVDSVPGKGSTFTILLPVS